MSAAISADVILHNGKIWRGHDEGVCAALAIWGDRILATGSDDDIMALRGPDTEVVDLGGRFATPGLNDNHLHLMPLGLTMSWVDASPDAHPTLKSLQAALRKRAEETPEGGWVMARGYDQVKLDIGRHPDRSELDEAVPDRPVVLVRACGHVTLGNSKAFEMAGIDETTPAPAGGVIEKVNGRLTGLLAENAQGLLRDAPPRPSVDELIDAAERAGEYLLSRGITSCMEAAAGMTAGMAEMQAYHLAKRDGRLPVRVWLVLLGDPETSIVEECHAAGLVSGVGDEMLRVGGVKIFLDGSTGGRTAWMKEPYAGEDATTGVQILGDAELDDLVLRYVGQGYQMACHAIGDAAIEQLITAYEKANAAHPDRRHRHRIEHCGYSDAGQHERMKAAGIIPAPQQVFLYDFGNSYASVLGGNRAHSAYPLRTWTDMGFRPSTGSDAPVCKPDPWPNIYTMITRKTWDGTVMDEGQRVTIGEALRAYTEYGAYSQNAEGEKGRLIPGQLADIAVFSRDMLTAEPEEILHDTHCVMTLLGGRIVHRTDS
ncbi:amidohydrolase [Roseovarius sp. SCSIO 43702]|uniref:amidohydrolase n=1 Tax=Roseovarius sp. SCSIO 43702 TaxID=2823043 RepID=UPI001C736E89|nr:amidohydrolase [Roseovarius sp. SCSIO 43702]QYX56907.1 amidohydrolase [Roseovarius sp. SCSIO 43702]